jgi:DNA-binding beta-propeller fold protein YncE
MFVFGTVLVALLGICMIFIVTQASAANLAEPGAPENPLNEYPSTWVVVVGNTGTLHMVNTASNIVYGPFMTHEMGSEGGGLFDVAVTPNGKTALVSNFGDSMISFVNISNPLSPSLMATVTMVITWTDDGNPLVPTDTKIINRHFES